MKIARTNLNRFVIDFIFILLGKKYTVRASDFWAATGYMNGIREDLFVDAIWVSNGEPNTFVLGKNDFKEPVRINTSFE